MKRSATKTLTMRKRPSTPFDVEGRWCGGMVLRGCEAGTRRRYEPFRGVHRGWVAVGFQMPRAFIYALAAAITLSML